MPRHLKLPRRFARAGIAGLAVVSTASAACRDTSDSAAEVVALARQDDRIAAHARNGVVEISATGLEFHAPSSVRSGWTTFRFRNMSDAEHFVILEKLPAGKTLADSEAEVVPVFQAGMDLLIAGEVEAALAKFGELPAWYPHIVFAGGPGLTSPGATSEVVVDLEPGTYVLECYVKTEDGKFHSYLGMVHELIVTGPGNGLSRPTPTVGMKIRNDGIHIDGPVRPGRHIIAVEFEEQMVHGNFLGTDVHLARLADDTDLDALADWMNWAAPSGLSSPAPARFVTGIHEMPAGHTGYIEVVLRPGRYAWIAEVDDPAGKNMLHTFTVPATANR